MGAAQADWDDKMRGKAKPAEPMDAAARLADPIALKLAGLLDTGVSAEQAYAILGVIQEIKQAARQDERRKVLRKVAQWHNDQAKGYENSGGGSQALNHRRCARHFIALAEEVT